MRDQLRIGSGLCWTVAWLAVAGAAAWWLLDPSGLSWTVAFASIIPVIVLAAWRAEKKALRQNPVPRADEGLWGPPMDLGGL